jgi:hypothetical protein
MPENIYFELKMRIDETKKQTNIAEYIIHMYQTEDLIRAFDFDIELIKEYVIKHIPENEESKTEMADWYVKIISQIKAQGIEKGGHLSEIQKLVKEIDAYKDKLLTGDKDFEAIYSSAKPSIEEFIKLSEGTIESEIQICLNGVYGLLLARLNGREIPEEIMPALDHFGNVLSYLSYKYKQEEFLSDN